MSFASWVKSRQKHMHAVVRTAERLRNRYGADADALCEQKLLRALNPIVRRNLIEVARTLRHIAPPDGRS